MRSLEPAYAWSMSTTFHTQRVLTARLSKFRRCISFTKMPFFQNVQEIGSTKEPTCGQDLRCQGHAAIPSTNQPYGTMDGGGCNTKVIRQCLFLHCKEPVFAVSNQSSRCCSSGVAKPSTTYRNSSEAVEDPQVQFLIVAAHTSDTCSKTCSAVPCLRHSYILTAILRAYIGSLWIPSLLFAEKQRKFWGGCISTVRQRSRSNKAKPWHLASLKRLLKLDQRCACVFSS